MYGESGNPFPNPSIWDIIKLICFIIVSFIVIPICLLLDTPYLCLIVFLIFKIGMMVFLISFFMTLITMIVQTFKLFSGSLQSGKFVEIFGCNINLLILIFGSLIIYSANKNLDSSISNVMSVSYVLVLLYQLYKFMVS